MICAGLPGVWGPRARGRAHRARRSSLLRCATQAPSVRDGPQTPHPRQPAAVVAGVYGKPARGLLAYVDLVNVIKVIM